MTTIKRPQPKKQNPGAADSREKKTDGKSSGSPRVLERQCGMRVLFALSLREVGLETAFFQVDVVQDVIEFYSQNIFS